MTQYLYLPPVTQPLNTSKRFSMVDTVSNYSAVTTQGYLAAQQALGHVFAAVDLIYVVYSGGQGYFTIALDANSNATLSPLPTGFATDMQQFVGLKNILINSVGTWTITRVAQGDYSLVHTAAANTSNISFDITPSLRAASGLGFELVSLDVVHQIGTLALNAHTLTLQSVAYANNVANAITSVALTGSLSTATQTNPYVDSLTVTTPAFLNTACAKYVAELTVNAAASTAYQLYGLNLHFTKSAP